MIFIDSKVIDGYFSSLEKSRIAKSNRDYLPTLNGERLEYFEKGLKAHLVHTSELSDEESRNLEDFLIDNNMTLSYDPYGTGFSARKNDVINREVERSFRTA